ncbi:hypothetical protein AVEN_13128-1, partial [Araneus ventricosus]
NFQPIHLGGFIHGETSPCKWLGSTPQHSDFQPLHLGESVTEPPCKSHYRSLRSHRTKAPIPLPTFKTGPPLRFRESLTLPQDGSTFCGFRFREKATLPLLTVAFQLLWPNAPNG